jgi:hypothetical protein
VTVDVPVEIARYQPTLPDDRQLTAKYPSNAETPRGASKYSRTATRMGVRYPPLNTIGQPATSMSTVPMIRHSKIENQETTDWS